MCYSHKYQADALCLSRDIFICFWFSNRACFHVTSQAKANLDCVSVQQRLNATVFNAISKRQISISESRKTKQDKAKFDCASVQQRLNATVFNAISKKQIWISKSKAPVHPHISSFCTSINVPLLPSQGSVYVSTQYAHIDH